MNRLITISVALAALFCTVPVQACTTCFGTPGSAQTQGMNAAIFTLLGVTGGVLSVAACVVAALSWRARGLS